MADKTGIGWTEATWNPIVGCSIVSAGCTHCYAMGMAARIERMAAGAGKETHYAGTTKPSKAGAVWTGKMAKAPAHILVQPLRWARPRRIFVNSMSDLFHEDVPDAWVDEVFAVMIMAKDHTFQILTKRADRMEAYMEQLRGIWADDKLFQETFGELSLDLTNSPCAIGAMEDVPFPPPNVWLGVSAEDQRAADARVPALTRTPAAVRFVSYEPAIGPIDFERIVEHDKREPEYFWYLDVLHGTLWDDASGVVSDNGADVAKVDWIIVGGESGPRAREFHLDWARSLVRDAADSPTAVFVKQLGSRPMDSSELGTFPVATKHGKGEDMEEWPAMLRVQQYPAAVAGEAE